MIYEVLNYKFDSCIKMRANEFGKFVSNMRLIEFETESINMKPKVLFVIYNGIPIICE